jgi:hypothetical protein
VCQAQSVEIQINDELRRTVAYGTTRGDTIEVCDDDNNGFGYTFNWNVLGTGTHRLRAFADGAEFANVAFNVTTLGGAASEFRDHQSPVVADRRRSHYEKLRIFSRWIGVSHGIRLRHTGSAQQRTYIAEHHSGIGFGGFCGFHSFEVRKAFV